MRSNLHTIFPRKVCHIPKWFVIDATGKTLGRLATEVSKYLRGKETSLFTPNIDQGNFVVVLNSNKISLTGKKEQQKAYFRNSQRPGGLKKESFTHLKERLPSRILEHAIWGMLPKGRLGRQYYKRLYVYSKSTIPYNTKIFGVENDTKFKETWSQI